MNQKAIVSTPLSELMAEYPLHGRVEGWYFRQREISNGAWRVEGVDRWGRLVSRVGSDPDALLAACVLDAESVKGQIGHAP